MLNVRCQMSGVQRKSFGFSLLEILIVMSIIIVLVGVSIGIYGALRNRSALDVDAQKIVSALRLARNRTLASQNTSSHGVYFETSDDSFTNFEGSTYNPIDPNNQTIFLDNRVEFLNIQLSGGAMDTVFSRLSGQTFQDGFIEIADTSDSTETRIICIEISGAVRILNPTDISASCNAPAIEYTGGTTDADLASFPNDSGWGDPAQSFTVGSAALNVSTVDLYIKAVGTPSNIFLEIRENSTVGKVIGKSLLVESATLPTSLSWVQFSFPSPIQLTASAQYFMRLRSLPESTINGSLAAGIIIWGYKHSASAPPAYGEGDAWRFIGANNDPAYQEGEQLGPADQYDFSFKIFTEDGPTFTDSRHLEFDFGDSLRKYTSITLSFNGGVTTEIITIADFMNSDSTIFDWQGTIDVSGSNQTIRIHSLYIDDYSTVLSVHRDGELNDVSLDIDIEDTVTSTIIRLVSYDADGVPTKGADPKILSMIYR